MKKLYTGLVGVTAASAMALQANAADWHGGSEAPGYAAVAVPVPVWAGFYWGPNLGYGWSTESDQLACTSTTCLGLPAGPFGGLSPSGWSGGLQFGYNWQGFGYSPLVVGIETDVQASTVFAKGGDAAGDYFHSGLEAVGTVRGRVGYAWDCTLLYFTGGLAWGTIHNEAFIPAANGGASADFVTFPTTTGYVLGGGIEYKFWRDLSVKVEYQYINLGKNDPVDSTLGAYSANGGALRDDAFNTVRVGLNWWPFGSYVPLPLK